MRGIRQNPFSDHAIGLMLSFPGGVNAAFQLTRTGPTGGVGAVNVNAVQSGNSVTITFLSGGVIDIDKAGSLLDGIYQLTVVASAVQGVGGKLDGDGNGTSANYGGVTKTIALIYGSKCVDAGENVLNLRSDQREGDDTITTIYYPRVNGIYADMGAFETDYAEGG